MIVEDGRVIFEPKSLIPEGEPANHLEALDLPD